MSEQLRSILLGTLGLDAVLVVALLVALRSNPAARLGLAPWVAIAMQAQHFAEEYAAAFHVRFPTFLGLAPWPLTFFVGLNVAFLVVFCVAALVGPRFYPARTALWALAIASVLNAVAHPSVALASNGYFPGLVTSPFVGAAGVFLGWRLLRR